MAELNKPGVPVKWLKDGVEIGIATVEMRSEGTKHYLKILNAKTDDIGEYTIVAADKSATANLGVDGKEYVLFK